MLELLTEVKTSHTKSGRWKTSAFVFGHCYRCAGNDEISRSSEWLSPLWLSGEYTYLLLAVYAAGSIVVRLDEFDQILAARVAM